MSKKTIRKKKSGKLRNLSATYITDPGYITIYLTEQCYWFSHPKEEITVDFLN